MISGIEATASFSAADHCDDRLRAPTLEAERIDLYHHFGSKEELARAVVDEYSARTLRTLQSFAMDPKTTGLEKVGGYFHELVTRFVAFESRVGCLVGKFSTELAPSSEYFRELLAASLDAWRGVA